MLPLPRSISFPRPMAHTKRTRVMLDALAGVVGDKQPHLVAGQPSGFGRLAGFQRGRQVEVQRVEPWPFYVVMGSARIRFVCALGRGKEIEGGSGSTMFSVIPLYTPQVRRALVSISWDGIHGSISYSLMLRKTQSMRDARCRIRDDLSLSRNQNPNSLLYRFFNNTVQVGVKRYGR